MKKYILNILLFFGIVSIIDLGFGALGDYLQAHAKGGSTKRINDLMEKSQYDILVLGSSRAHHHYDTPFISDSLSLDVYNAGYDGNGVVLAYGIFESITERYQPKLVLFDVEPSFDIYEYKADNNHKRYISTLKPYYRKAAIGSIIRDVSIEEWYKCHSGLIRYNSNIISMGLENLFGRIDDSKGYEPLTGQYKKEPEFKQVKEEIKDDFKLAYMVKLLQLAKSKSIPIAVIASPKYGHNSATDLQPVKDICRDLKVPFLDYYADSEFMSHKEWFKEPMHLNHEGARQFSKRLISDMELLLK